MYTPDEFAWKDFNHELAGKLREYRNHRKELADIVWEANATNGLGIKLEEDGSKPQDMDPFTVFGLFIRQIKEINSSAIAAKYARIFQIKSPVPKEGQFRGLPRVNNFKTEFYSFKSGRGEHDIDNLWKVFEAALKYDKESNEENEKAFVATYDVARSLPQVELKLSMALYWMCPDTFINLDKKEQAMLGELGLVDKWKGFGHHIPPGKEYLAVCQAVKAALSTQTRLTNFAELSAWAYDKHSDEENTILRNIFTENRKLGKMLGEHNEGSAREGRNIAAMGHRRDGQSGFRQRLLRIWGGQCAVTGCSDERLLYASHAKPWSKSTPKEKTNPYNGLLLEGRFDALFDHGLISFGDEGTILISPQLDKATRKTLGITESMHLRKPLCKEHFPFLEYHRGNVYLGK